MTEEPQNPSSSRSTHRSIQPKVGICDAEDSEHGRTNRCQFPSWPCPRATPARYLGGVLGASGGWHAPLAPTSIVQAQSPSSFAEGASLAGQGPGLDEGGQDTGLAAHLGVICEMLVLIGPSRLFLTAIITGSALDSGTVGSGHRLLLQEPHWGRAGGDQCRVVASTGRAEPGRQEVVGGRVLDCWC